MGRDVPREQRVRRQAAFREDPQGIQVASQGAGRGGARRGRLQGTYHSAHYARIRGQRGPAKAAVATGHSILVIAYHLLSNNQPYSDLGADYFVQRQTKTAYKKRLVRQLERMGYDVTLEPVEAA